MRRSMKHSRMNIHMFVIIGLCMFLMLFGVIFETGHTVLADTQASSSKTVTTSQSKKADSGARQGFVTKNGKTYYLDAKGQKVKGLKKLKGKDGKVHTYYFDKKGVMQTGFQYIKSKNKAYLFKKKSGIMVTGKYKVKRDGKNYTYEFKNNGVLVGVNSKVDKMANKKLNELGRSLKKAYEWCRTFPYRALISDPSKGTGHYAAYGFKNGTGNCYVKAATFAAMARQLGYPVRQLGGYCRTQWGRTPHSWTEIYYKGKWRVCDPSWGRRYSYMSGWMIQYGQKGTWVYAEYKKLKN